MFKVLFENFEEIPPAIDGNSIDGVARDSELLMANVEYVQGTSGLRNIAKVQTTYIDTTTKF